MPQSKERHAEYMREKRKTVNPVNPELKSVNPVNPELITDVRPITTVKPSDDYPVIIHWLADDVKREKLRAISNTLANRNVSEHVRFGVNGLTFDAIGELLTAFPVSSKLGKSRS